MDKNTGRMIGDTARKALEEIAREKARNLRYRKPIVCDLNLYAIKSQLADIQEACADVQWYCDSADGNDTLLNVLDGNEEEAYEFKIAFSDLSYECERLADDLENYWLPDCFDKFFAGIGADSVGGGMLGYDEYVGDYMPLDGGYETEIAHKEAAKQIMRLTKTELIDAAMVCFRVAVAFFALRSRYDDLKAAMDILRGQNTAMLQQIRAIDEAYNKAAAENFDSWESDSREFDRLLAQLPERVWIE